MFPSRVKILLDLTRGLGEPLFDRILQFDRPLHFLANQELSTSYTHQVSQWLPTLPAMGEWTLLMRVLSRKEEGVTERCASGGRWWI